ncbi:MAG: hypothetical protein KC912_01550 [Proteobacteria bacterium]|nr:hypothetical protein [Pseudomonadota bacterium]
MRRSALLPLAGLWLALSLACGGGPNLERDGGVAYRFAPVGFEAERGVDLLDDRLQAAGLVAEVSPQHGEIVVEIAGVVEPELITGPLFAQGVLTLHALGASHTAAFAAKVGEIERTGGDLGLRKGESLLRDDDGHAYIVMAAALDNSHIASARADVDIQGGPMVQVWLTSDGGETFYALTERNVGRQIVVALDGQVLMAPVVREPIPGGMVAITLGGQGGSGETLAAALSGGALPGSLELTSTVLLSPLP